MLLGDVAGCAFFSSAGLPDNPKVPLSWKSNIQLNEQNINWKVDSFVSIYSHLLTINGPIHFNYCWPVSSPKYTIVFLIFYCFVLQEVAAFSSCKCKIKSTWGDSKLAFHRPSITVISWRVFQARLMSLLCEFQFLSSLKRHKVPKRRVSRNKTFFCN